MKAALVTEYGGPEVLKITTDAPRPSIGPEDVLVEVHAAGVNPFDWKVRSGLVRSMAELTFPAVLGGDVSGIVVETGSDVTHVQPGETVYGLAGALSSHGSFAEFAPVKGTSLTRKPAQADFVQAAALPLVGVSAYQALVDILHVQAGQKVLIHGGAGGIGSIAIQLAKHLGAYVASTASSAQSDFVKSLGADEVIDYHTEKFQDKLSGYDAVFDTVGGEVYRESFKILKPGGAIASMSAPSDSDLATQYQVTATGMFTQATIERLTKLAELVDSGAITVPVDKIFSLDDAAQALDYLQNGHPQGKVVIQVKA